MKPKRKAARLSPLAQRLRRTNQIDIALNHEGKLSTAQRDFASRPTAQTDALIDALGKQVLALSEATAGSLAFIVVSLLLSGLVLTVMLCSAAVYDATLWGEAAQRFGAIWTGILGLIAGFRLLAEYALRVERDKPSRAYCVADRVICVPQRRRRTLLILPNKRLHFNVPADVARQFEPDGRYKLYFAEGSRRLVALEWIGYAAPLDEGQRADLIDRTLPRQHRLKQSRTRLQSEQPDGAAPHVETEQEAKHKHLH